MKKLLFSLSLLASFATFADSNAIDASAQVTGVLPVTVSTTNVIVSVPWIASGYDDSAISVSNIIKTANMTVGDTVKVWNKDKSSFDVWTLAQGSDGVKYWSGITTVTPTGMSKADGADVTTVARGGALILTRGSNWDGNSYTFYVIGQVGSSTTTTVDIAIGSKDTPAFTLIAAPYASKAWDLNDDATWANLENGGIYGDRIYIGNGSDTLGSFVYYNTKKKSWGAQRGSWTKASAIPAGIGCWYASSGTNTAVKLTWKKEFDD